VNPGGLQNRHVRRRADAALADDGDPGRDLRPQFQSLFQTRREGSQVAVVDTDDRRPAIEHPRQLLGIVEFDQHIQPDGSGFAK